MIRSDVIAMAVRSGLRTEAGVSEFAYLDRLEMFVGLVEQHLASLPAAEEDARGGWISVGDRLPDDDGKFLVAASRFITGEQCVETAWFRYGTQEFDALSVTHWTPLPAAPAMSQDSKGEGR